MAAFEYDFRTEPQLREAIDDPRQQHHATFGGDRGDQDSERGDGRDSDQHDVDLRRQRIPHSITTAPLNTKKTTDRL